MSKLQSYNIHYKLKSLPTYQHRAGLGGLAFLLDYLRKQELPVEERVAVEMTPESLSVEFTPPP